MVTIYDIAKKMRLSHTTVSMALRNMPCVRDSTRRKVTETAQKMGYRKNQIALSLKQGVFKRIVLVVHSFEVYGELINSLDTLCGEAGYELVLMHLEESPEKMRRTFRQIVDGGYAGCAAYFYNYAPIGDLVSEFIASGHPFVALNMPLDLEVRPGLFRLDVNPDVALENVLEALYSLGHRKIACSVMEPYFATSYPVEKYYKYVHLKKFLLNHSITLPWDPGFFYQSRYPIDYIQDGYEASKRILTEKPGVSALLCKNDQFAFGLMKGLSEEGIRVPEDLSLVASDNSKMAKFSVPSITSVDLRQKEMAHMVWNILRDELGKHVFSEIAPPVILQGELFLRESIGPAKG